MHCLSSLIHPLVSPVSKRGSCSQGAEARSLQKSVGCLLLDQKRWQRILNDGLSISCTLLACFAMFVPDSHFSRISHKSSMDSTTNSAAQSEWCKS